MQGLKTGFLAGALACSGIASAATIKIATVAPDGTAWMREMRAAADAIKKATDGRVEIKYYPGGVMGDAATVLRKIKIGQLQGGAFTGGEATVITPDAQVYSLPFLYRSQDEIDKVRAKLDPLVKQAFDAGRLRSGRHQRRRIRLSVQHARHQDARGSQGREGLGAAGRQGRRGHVQGRRRDADSAAAVGRLHQPADRADRHGREHAVRRDRVPVAYEDEAHGRPAAFLRRRRNCRRQESDRCPERRGSQGARRRIRGRVSRVWKRATRRTTRPRAKRSSSRASRSPQPDEAERKNWEAVGTEAFKELCAAGRHNARPC